MAASRTAIIINPIAGSGGRLDVARRRAERVSSLLSQRGVEADVLMTERPGHARELAEASLARGAGTVMAWGGDGTVNEVASALAFRDATLGVIPGGSGNGLARELRLPFDLEQALAVALGPSVRRIDAGELDGRLFFNVAGIGLDARVAHRFAAAGPVRRGLARYVAITAQELFAYEPDCHTVTADGATLRGRALLIAIANTRQYGNGAIIAPAARVDDGRLDVVMVAARPPLAALMQAPGLFMGRIAHMRGVTMCTAAEIEVTSTRAVMYHVDGEPSVGTASLRARARPGALRVAVPPGARDAQARVKS